METWEKSNENWKKHGKNQPFCKMVLWTNGDGQSLSYVWLSNGLQTPMCGNLQSTVAGHSGLLWWNTPLMQLGPSSPGFHSDRQAKAIDIRVQTTTKGSNKVGLYVLRCIQLSKRCAMKERFLEPIVCQWTKDGTIGDCISTPSTIKICTCMYLFHMFSIKIRRFDIHCCVTPSWLVFQPWLSGLQTSGADQTWNHNRQQCCLTDL